MLFQKPKSEENMIRIIPPFLLSFLICPLFPSVRALEMSQAKAPAVRISEILVKGNKALTNPTIITTSGLAVGQPYNEPSVTTAAKKIQELGLFGFGMKNPQDAVK